MGNYNFDFDLPEGEAGERLVKEILTGEYGTVEVKRDYLVTDTGNVAIEFNCRGKKSGIAISTAVWWAIVLDGAKFGHEIVILIKRIRLLKMAREFYKKGSWTYGGDDNTSQMVLIPVKEIVSWCPSAVIPTFI